MSSFKPIAELLLLGYDCRQVYGGDNRQIIYLYGEEWMISQYLYGRSYLTIEAGRLLKRDLPYGPVRRTRKRLIELAVEIKKAHDDAHSRRD